MGISIQEFRISMEVYGATRLRNRRGTRYDFAVPCFTVAGVEFLHSGSYYIVQRGQKATEEVMNQAMAVFGEKHPGKEHFWWGETHSIQGILTLVAILDHKYSKELVDRLTNQTYKILLKCRLIQSDVKMPFYALPSPRFKKLREVLDVFDSMTNPYGNPNIKLKDPIEYLDKVKINLGFSKKNIRKRKKVPYANLSLSIKNSSTSFSNNPEGLSYQANGYNILRKGKKSGSTSVFHTYNTGCDGRPVDEFIGLRYTTADGYGEHPGDIDLRISMRSGLAWRTYQEKEAAPATDEQIKTMITHIKRGIRMAKRRIVKHMVAESQA